ncbi:uncharacterized protein LOC122092304 [Macadamia integrifolia]|uniref:uncharacterized protein LOC122092304 n=1 Tax=Macadamia integrifolia TaxID=60698 RepID=UPI001C52D876|nr:uncharacterized protein LOC122092304 [Macadamia integrifolia]
MAFKRSTIQHLLRSLESKKLSSLSGSSRSYSKIDAKVLIHGSNMLSSCKEHDSFPWIQGSATTLRYTMGSELSFFLNDTRLLTTQVKAPPQTRQMGGLKVAMQSPGIIYEPYAPREPIPFWRRWFTRSGWRRTKEDIILELKSAYAINKLRKSGYNKQKFYQDTDIQYVSFNSHFQFYFFPQINTLIAHGDKTSLRKLVTENMYSGLKNEIKQRESKWSSVYWELVEPVEIRTLRARLYFANFMRMYEELNSLLPISGNEQEMQNQERDLGILDGIDKNNLNKVFIQLTLEFLAKQKFEAYDSKGAIVAGDKTKEVEII